MSKFTLVNMGSGDRFQCLLPDAEKDYEVKLPSWEVYELFNQMQQAYRRQDVIANIIEDEDFAALFEKWCLTNEDIAQIQQDIFDSYCAKLEDDETWFFRLRDAALEVLQPYKDQYDKQEGNN